MKKLFLAITLAAAVTTSFMSCNKTTTDSDTHTQQFTLGETTFDIKNALTIENIKDSIGQIYNAIVLAQGEIVDDIGGRAKGAIIVFKGSFTQGIHNLVFDPQQPLDHFPMYLIGEIDADNIVNFCLDSLLNQADVHVANNGSFTLSMDQDKFTVTTTGIQVTKVKDPTQVTSSSVDFEDDMLRYVLSTVEEGNFNGDNIVTAGRTVMNIFSTPSNIVAFITENGDLIGFISWANFDNGIPEGTYTFDDNAIVYLKGMSFPLDLASGGEVSVAKNGDIYTIDMTGLSISGIYGTPTMHYVGTMPKFDFPFLK